MKNIQAGVEKGRYGEASDVYTDLTLVFWNALFYNESDSQIAMDASSLKVSSKVSALGILLITFFFTLYQNLLETEWTKRSVLPQLRTSPPPSSAQKVHAVAVDSNDTTLPPAPATPARTVTPAGQGSNASSDPYVDITSPDSDGPEEDEPVTQTDAGDGDNTEKKLPSPGRIQQQQQTPQQPPATTTAMVTLQTAHAAQSQNPYQHFQQPYIHQQQQQQQIVNQPQTQRSATSGPDRSIITAAGGITAIGGPSQVEKLPADTGKFS